MTHSQKKLSPLELRRVPLKNRFSCFLLTMHIVCGKTYGIKRCRTFTVSTARIGGGRFGACSQTCVGLKGECLNLTWTNPTWRKICSEMSAYCHMCPELHGLHQIIVSGKNYSPIDMERAAEKAKSKA